MSEINFNKLVSIIVPAYNVEKYIRECLESLVEQTYRNVEIIVVDDGSRDGTWAIISELMENDSRIRGFHQENNGVSAARNYALEKACGDYIQFVDGDDYLPRDAVEKLVAAMESNSAEWVNCQYHRVDESGNALEEYNFIEGYTDLSHEDSKLTFIRDILIEYHAGYEIWNKLYLADIIRTADLRFDEKCHMGEDLEFNIRYSLLVGSIVCICDRLYYYRVRGGSAMDSITSLSDNINERLLLIRGIEEPVKAYFTIDNEEKFSQIFYKLMLYVCKGHTMDEIADAAAASPYRDYYVMQMSEALELKDTFTNFFPENLALMYWRAGYYILTRLNGSIKGKLYFVIYNLFRILKGREVISEWKPV